MESSKKIFGSFFELFTEEEGERPCRQRSRTGAVGKEKDTGITLPQGLENN
jgi:hypothetical protein